MNTKPILAFDCACVGGSVALCVGTTTTTHRVTQSKEAAELIPAIDTLLNASGVGYADLGAIITTVGPGSFTGVRIGLAALHGLVLANTTPIKTLTTLTAMAWAIAQTMNAPSDFYIALRAGKGEVYAQRFETRDGRLAARNDITLTPEDFTAWDAPCFGNHLPAEDAHYLNGPDAAVMAAIAQYLPITPLAAALPVYIRPPDAIIGAPYPWMRTN